MPLNHPAIHRKWPGVYVCRGDVIARVDGQSSPLPSAADIATAESEYAAVATGEQRDRELAVKALKAVAIATHKRFKAQIPTDTTTAAQWETAIQAEYDAL